MTHLPAVSLPNSLLMDAGTFDHMQRVAKVLSLSALFPEHLRKGSQDVAIANGILVLNMAARLNEDPLTVAQNIYFVSNKPGWSASYMIAKANQHGVFSGPIDWEVSDGKSNLSVTAFAELSSTGKRVAVTCDMAMAKAEGWTKNAKYQSMPEQMLRYRSAVFLIRLYCPEVMVGVPAQIENELVSEPEMRDVTPMRHERPDAKAVKKPAAHDVEAEAADDTPPKKTRHEIQKEFEAENRRKAVASKARSDTEAPDEKQPDDRNEDAQADEEPIDTAPFRRLADMILGELTDGASPDEIEELYADQIAQMRDRAPGVAKEVDEHIQAARDKPVKG